MRTESERRRALGEAVHTAAETLRVDELGAEPLDWLTRAVDASSVLLYRYDAQCRPEAHGGPLRHAIVEYCAELFAEDPLQHSLFQLAEPPAVILPASLAGFDPRRYQRSAAYHEFYRRFEMEHLLGSGLTSIPYGRPGMTGILLSRSARQQPFDALDMAVLREAVPAFQAAVRRADRLDRELSEKRAVVAPAALPPRQLAERLAGLRHRHQLTDAEVEVLALLAEGLSNKEIAARRFVSLETVKTHVQRILGKLAVTSRTQAALLANGAAQQSAA